MVFGFTPLGSEGKKSVVLPGTFWGLALARDADVDVDVLEVVCVAGEVLLPHATEVTCLRVLMGREGKASPVSRLPEFDLDVVESGVKEGRLPQLP